MKTVLITGCSSGYGLETARHFHAQGWNVVATMRTPREDVLPRSERLRMLPQLRARRSGVVVNVTSSATLAPMPMVAVYVPADLIRGAFELHVYRRGSRSGLSPNLALEHHSRE